MADVRIDGAEDTVIPAGPLPANTRLTVTIEAGIESQGGLVLEGPVS